MRVLLARGTEEKAGEGRSGYRLCVRAKAGQGWVRMCVQGKGEQEREAGCLQIAREGRCG